MQGQESLQKRGECKSQSLKMRLNLPIEPFNRSKTALSDCFSQTVSSRQALTQRSSRYCPLWEKDWCENEKRRQNQLQSMFRVRKQKLQQITKENKNLYVRLNTKVSQYSARQHLQKSKQSQESQCLTFRTLGLKESRQILGPIMNFRPSTEFKMYNQQQNFIGDNQNHCQQRQSIILKSRQKQVQVLKLSISKKLKLYKNQQKTQRNDFFKSRNITISKKSNKQNFYRNSQIRQGLPEIYTFF